MAKQGMKRIDRTHKKPKNDFPPVPEIEGKAKHSKAKVNPIIAGTKAPSQKVYHSSSQKQNNGKNTFFVIDTDLAVDNLLNDLSAADRQDI